MGVRLKNPNGSFPPGGYTFDDPHTAMHFPGEGVDLYSQALKVIEHRKANPHIYKPEDTIKFDHKFIEGEIIIQVCARHPSYCEDSDRPGVPYPAPPEPTQHEVYRQQGKVCPKCQGQDFTPVRCRTCGGNRISGYRCLKCGFES